MSEQWAIVLLTGVVGWVAYEVHALRESLARCVLKDDCATDMGEHCSQIKDLREKVQENSEELATVKAKVETFHGDVK